MSIWSNISSLLRADMSVRHYTYMAHAVAWGWEPEWTTVWHFIMHAVVIHLRLSVTPSAAVAQVVLRHNLSTSDCHLRLDAVQCFAPGYRRFCVQVQDYSVLRVQHRYYSSMLGQKPWWWKKDVSFKRQYPQDFTVSKCIIIIIIITIIITIFINCNWVVTQWQWLFYMYTNMKKK